MSAEFLSLAMFAILILAITLGHPLAFTLAAVATLFGLIENGFNVHRLMYMFVNNTWGLMDNYTLVAIPLFIVMAQLLDRSKVAEALFDSLYIVLGSVRGGLGLAVVLVCTIFAATTGIIGASVVAMTLLATPVLMEKGYQKEMTAGIICASGTLGILIPPSIMMVVYGGLTGIAGNIGRQPVRRISHSGPAAGRSLFSLHHYTMRYQSQIRPPHHQGRSQQVERPAEMGMTLKSMMPPLLLILMVMGTILGGIATPTEAAGMGAAGALLLAFFNKKLNWTVLRDSCHSTLKTTAMVMALFIGGKLFSVVFIRMGGGGCGGGSADRHRPGPLVGPLHHDGCGLHHGHVHRLGRHSDDHGAHLPAHCHGDRFRPPVVFHFDVRQPANLLFDAALRLRLVLLQGGGTPEYTMMHVYRGIIPFVLLQMTGILILMAFPSLVTFLPEYFFGR
jgi:tripartite ATP-independent transporter DctM subunit